MADLIEYVTEKVKEDFTNATNDRERKEAEFKAIMLMLYHTYDRESDNDSSIIDAEHAKELKHTLYHLLYVIGNVVYNYNKVLEEEYYESVEYYANHPKE